MTSLSETHSALLPDTERQALLSEYVRVLLSLASKADPLAAPAYITRIDRILGIVWGKGAHIDISRNGATPDTAESPRPPVRAATADPGATNPPPFVASQPRQAAPPPAEATSGRTGKQKRGSVSPLVDAFLRRKAEATTDEILDHVLAGGVYAGLEREVARKRLWFVLTSKSNNVRSVRRGVWALKAATQ